MDCQHAPIVRAAVAEDLPEIVRLSALLGRQHAGYDPARFDLAAFSEAAPIEEAYRAFFAEQLARPGARVLVAEASGRIAGYAFVRIEEASFLDLSAPAGWIHDIYLDEAHRGRGAGGALFDAAVAALRSLGARRVRLTVSPHNDAAQRLFEKRGFRPTMIERTLDL